MSELLQPGLHPDAEALNAFAEGALPAHDREQALAHLAVCADCREIVFLAQQAQPMATAEAPAESIWQRWLRSAPVFGIGIGAAVLAVALIFAVTLRTHRAAAPAATPQTASAHLPAPPLQPEEAPPKAAPPPRPPRTHPPVVNAPEPSPQFKPVPQPPSVNGFGRDWVTGSDRRGLVGGANYNAGAGSSSGAESAGGMGSGSGAGVAGAVMPATPAAAPPVGAADAAPQSASEMVTVQSEPQAVTVESPKAAGAQPLLAMAKMRSIEPTPRPLPSKLPATDVVSSGSRMLAADSAGTLFLSLDAGRHWTRVSAPWKGKVTQLRLARLAPSAAMQLRAEEQQSASDEARASALPDMGADKISPAAAPVKTATPLAVFQLVTDKGAVWVSSDGLHWQPAP